MEFDVHDIIPTQGRLLMRLPPCRLRGGAGGYPGAGVPGRRQTSTGVQPRPRVKPVTRTNRDPPTRVPYAELGGAHAAGDAATAIARADHLLIVLGDDASVEGLTIPKPSDMLRPGYAAAGLTKYAQLATIDWLRHDPDVFFGFWAEYINAVAESSPNALHTSIATLVSRATARAATANEAELGTVGRGETILAPPEPVRVVTFAADGLMAAALDGLDEGATRHCLYEARGSAARWQCSAPQRCTRKRGLFRLEPSFRIWWNKLTYRAPLYTAPPPTLLEVTAAAEVEEVADSDADLQFDVPDTENDLEVPAATTFTDALLRNKGGLPNSRAAASLLAQTTPDLPPDRLRGAVAKALGTAASAPTSFAQSNASATTSRVMTSTLLRAAKLETPGAFGAAGASALGPASPVTQLLRTGRLGHPDDLLSTRYLPQMGGGYVKADLSGRVGGAINLISVAPVPSPAPTLAPAQVTADDDEVDLAAPPVRPLHNHPHCPYCSRVARPNILMFNDRSFVSDPRSDFDTWLQSVSTVVHDPFELTARKLVILEIGVDDAYPPAKAMAEGVFDRLVRPPPDYDPFDNVTFIRISKTDSQLPPSLQHLDSSLRMSGPSFIPITTSSYTNTMREILQIIDSLDSQSPN